MIYDPRIFRRHDISQKVGNYQQHLLTFWYTILRRYCTQSLTFENDRFPAISGMAREIGARGNYTYKAGTWQEDAHRGLLWSTTGTPKRTSEYIAPSWNWASPIHQNGELYEKAYEVTENLSKILQIDVINVEDDTYGEVSSASLKIQGPWRSIDSWDQEQADHSHPDLVGKIPKIQVYFDSDVTRDGLSQDIICLQIAKAKDCSPIALPKLYGLLLRPISRDSPKNEYQRIGLAAIPTHGKIINEGWEQGTFTII
jgi:hypothetical protein